MNIPESKLQKYKKIIFLVNMNLGQLIHD